MATTTKPTTPQRAGVLGSITQGRDTLPPQRTLVYGVPGVGKSTFGAMADAPVFVQTEDGLSTIKADRFPLATCVADVTSQLAALQTEQHQFATVVVDSLDWLERLIWAQVAADQRVASIEEIGYGKGYTFALKYWGDVLRALSALRNEREMEVILVAHSHIVKFAHPETEPFDRFEPRLHKSAVALVTEWCDNVLFACYRVATRKTDEGFGRKRSQGVGSGERILRTTDRPAHNAKNRVGLPDEMQLDYRVFAAYVRGEEPSAD